MTLTNVTTGMNTTYDLTTGIPVNIDELIYMLSPDDSPLITGVNSDGLQVIPTAPVDQTTFTWMDEERLTPQTTLGAAVTDETDTYIQVAAGTRPVFSTGDLLKIEVDGADSGEILRVTGYNATANRLDVTRGFAGTTARTAGYANGSKVVGLGTLLAEGSDPSAARSADRTLRTNYTQIFGPTKVEMSRSEQHRRKYGVASEFTHQLMNRMVEDVIRRERALLYGQAYTDGAQYRVSGGLDYWISDSSVVDTTNTGLTIANITTLMQACYNNGGVPTIMTCNPAMLGALNDIEDEGRVRQTFEDGRRGRMPVMTVSTEFGILTVVRNRWCLVNNAFLWNRNQATRRVFDPVLFERLAKTGDSDSAQIVCEEGLEFKGATHAAKFQVLDPSP